MAKNKLSSADGEGFLRAVTDLWKDIEADTGDHLGMSLYPSGRKGVLQVTIAAYYDGDDNNTRVVARYECEYPTAQVGSLEAALYQALVRLERVLIDEDRYPMGKA